jgi:FAD:protein FMN transferase
MALASANWRALGTDIRLVVTEAEALPAARERAEQLIGELDEACSRFRADSELVRLDQAAGRPVVVSPTLFDALDVAVTAARLTDGDVDPSLGAQLASLGYDRTFSAISGDGPLVSVARVGSWVDIDLDAASRTVRIPPGMQLDLGATAKAWCADRIAAAIATQQVGVLASLGGDIAVAGPAPDDGWSVRVQDVTGAVEDMPDGPWQVVVIRDGGLATSSTTARRWTRGGQAVHHILNPASGRSADEVWRTVTVAAASCSLANAASTASIIRGARAPRWLESLALPARLVGVDGHIRLVNWPTPPDGVAS